MTEKHLFARKMVDEGAKNREVIAAVKERFGSGVATSVLARWRATSTERVRAQRRSFIEDGLEKGLSAHAIQKAYATAFGVGVGYNTIRKIEREMNAGLTGEDSTDIIPVEIPPEVHEEPPAELISTPPPNGSLNDLKAVHSWMKKINAKSLTLTENGDLSVLVEHNFHIGDPE
jgi:hypothetical protein